MGRKQRSDRIKDAKRQPGTGRLSQAAEFERARKNAQADAESWNAMASGMQARHRLHGIAYPAAPGAAEEVRKRPHVLDQRAGSVVGRLAMQGEISMAQYDAAVKYAEDVHNYRLAVSAPRQPGAVDLNAVRGGSADGADHVEFVRRAVRRFCGEKGGNGAPPVTGVRQALAECQGSIANRGQNLQAALDYLVLRDELHVHMIPWLRTALNALSRHYGFAERTEAA
jgi:hypothetical protein